MSGKQGKKEKTVDVIVWCGPCTLPIVLLLLCARSVYLADMGGCVTCLWLLVVAALIEDLRQVGSVDLPELLIII